MVHEVVQKALVHGLFNVFTILACCFFKTVTCTTDGKLAEKQEALRSSMVARFASADARLAASQSTLSFLQSQIDIWNSQGD